jgi:hypothetical protein
MLSRSGESRCDGGKVRQRVRCGLKRRDAKGEQLYG